MKKKIETNKPDSKKNQQEKFSYINVFFDTKNED